MLELRPYQQEDVNFLKKFDAIGCFNEQRTGKTPTALTLLKEKNCIKNLIICPASAIYQWIEEYELWLEKPCITTTKAQLKINTLEHRWTNGLIVSYDAFKTIQKKDGTIIPGIVEYILSDPPDAIILDEAHRIKNTKSANAKAVFKTIHIPVRIALTGTPAPNKPEEIYSILYWLFPRQYKSYWKFIDEYFEKKLEHNRQTQRPYVVIGDFKTFKKQELQLRLQSFSTQRKRKEVMQWLPEKDYQKVRLIPTKEQTKYLSELKDYYATEDILVQGTLDRLVRYRQICLHPGLLGLKGISPKLEYIKKYLEDYPERPTIIFSKFTSFLKLLDVALGEKEKGLIIGETPIKIRNELKTDFQCGKINLLLINIDAGKEALTLDRAEVTLFTDKYPPVGDIQQAEDRFISTTENKADKPHTIIELMMRDTYDEHLYKLLEQRKSATDIINDYKKYLTKGV